MSAKKPYRHLPCCDRNLPSNAAVAIGLFQPNGPIGYRALSNPDAPLRATREEAEQDQHFYLSPECAAAKERVA